MEIPLQLPLHAVTVEAIIVGEECLTWTKQDDEAASIFGLGDMVRRQKSNFCELPQVRTKLVALDDRAVFLHGQPAEPLGT
jgi:hypothetical protein